MVGGVLARIGPRARRLRGLGCGTRRHSRGRLGRLRGGRHLGWTEFLCWRTYVALRYVILPRLVLLSSCRSRLVPRYLIPGRLIPWYFVSGHLSLRLPWWCLVSRGRRLIGPCRRNWGVVLVRV